MERNLHAALGPKLRVGPPADIGEQACGMAQPCLRRIVAGKERRDPPVEHIAMFGKPAEPPPLIPRGLNQRVERAGILGERLIEQPLAQTERRGNRRARIEMA